MLVCRPDALLDETVRRAPERRAATRRRLAERMERMQSAADAAARARAAAELEVRVLSAPGRALFPGDSDRY
jgi:hypothetical protein